MSIHKIRDQFNNFDFYASAPVSVLISHLIQYYLELNISIWLKIMFLTLDHDLVTSSRQTTYLSSVDRLFVGCHPTDVVALRSSDDQATDDLFST